MKSELGMDLFALAQTLLPGLVAELDEHGLAVDHNLELRRCDGLLPYFDPADGHIHLPIPDPSTNEANLHSLVLRSMLGFDAASLLELQRLLLPRTLAHELGHHLRNRLGLYGADAWLEEKIADLLGSALTKRRLSAVERARLLDLLERALAARAAHDRERPGPTPQHALPADPTAQTYEAMSHDPVRYLLLQLQWIVDDLRSHRVYCVAELAAEYFTRRTS